jgi:hypothetical protein
MPIDYREDLDQMQCGNPDCKHHHDDTIHIASKRCPHKNAGLEMGCDHAEHALFLICSLCQRPFLIAALAQHGRTLPYSGGEEPQRSWGWEDWDKISEGHPQTWIPACHPYSTDIRYDKTSGEIWISCRACYRTFRYAIANRPPANRPTPPPRRRAHAQ